MLKVFLGILLLVGMGTKIFLPELFLQMPPNILSELFVYVVFSVPAQQLIFTFYLSRRHGNWWQDRPKVHIFVTAAVFGLAHIVFADPIPIIATALFGALMCWRYQRTHSLPLAIVEHALYGSLVFLIGFGSLIDSANV